MTTSKVFSLLVGNAFADQDKCIALGIPNASTTPCLTVLLQTYFNGTVFLVTLCGGSLRDSEPGGPIELHLSPLGGLTYATALDFLSPHAKVVLRAVTCTCGIQRMREKVYAGLAAAEKGDLVVFVGDMARSCDGKILPFLNLVPGQEAINLPRYQREGAST